MIIKERIKYLEDYLLNMVEIGDFPGASYGLMGLNQSHSSFLGKAQHEPVIDVKEDTLYDLASLTKVIATTTAIMILMERGYLTLDTHIDSILPRYKNKGIKIKHLLTHTSGHNADIYSIGMSKEELIDGIYKEKIDPSKFEKEIVYSDIGYILLGFAIEEITGSLNDFLYENIFKPLEMYDTFFNPKEEDKSRCAATEFCKYRKKIIKGIVHDEKSYILGGVSGHAGLFSSLNDILNFMEMILNEGTYKGKQLLSTQTIDLMIKNHTGLTDGHRGLGWMINNDNNILCDIASDKTIYHTGFTGTSIIIDLNYKKAFVLLSNRIHPVRENYGLIGRRRNIYNIAFSSII